MSNIAIPVISAYNNLSNSFNFMLFNEIGTGNYFVRFGELDIVRNHSGVKDRFLEEVAKALGLAESDSKYPIFYNRFQNQGGGMIGRIEMEGKLYFKLGTPRQCTIGGNSSVYRAADMQLVKRLLLETRTFDRVEIRK
jgi:hypothetical protein